MRTIFFSLALFAAVVQLAAQTSDTIHSDVSRVLSAMRSDKWTDREHALSEMPSIDDLNNEAPAEADRLKVALIELLTRENEEVHRPKSAQMAPTLETRTVEHGEGHANYYGNLIGMVAALHDERAIPALLGAITTGGMAERGVAGFGEKALDPLLKKILDPNPIVRSSVLFTARYMIRMGTANDPAAKARIDDVVRSSLNDADPSVRSSAIAVVEYLDNREEFVPALQKLAESDPAKLPGKPDDGGDGGQFFPVRQNARRLLRKISNHQPPPIDRGVR